MFAPWRSQKPVHKQKDLISGATHSMWSGALRASSYEPGFRDLALFNRYFLTIKSYT